MLVRLRERGALYVRARQRAVTFRRFADAAAALRRYDIFMPLRFTLDDFDCFLIWHTLMLRRCFTLRF